MEKFNKLIKAKEGFCLYNKNDQYVGRSIENYGEFSQLEVELFEQICKEGDTVIEVGANIALNSLTNVFTYQMALGNEDNTLMIPSIDYSKTGNFGGISIENTKKGEPVIQKKLDSFISQIQRLKLIKIDVEGMEKQVLAGSLKIIKKFKPILYVENDRQEKSQSLIEYIQSLGYELYWHLPKLYNPDNFYKNKNNIFGNIVSVNMLCVHKSLNINVEKMQKIEDSKLHPMRKNK